MTLNEQPVIVKRHADRHLCETTAGRHLFLEGLAIIGAQEEENFVIYDDRGGTHVGRSVRSDVIGSGRTRHG